MNYEESVAYMSGLLPFGIRLDRERFVALLARLGDPHTQLRCVHVAGTNGKGSTTTFIASALHAAGYRVGSYLSPYVFDLRERILLGGTMIPRADFARWVTIIRPHIEAIAATELGQTTEFELKTAVAFCWLAERNVDFAVIEVGIGGRLDATNVISPPLVAVITSIGLDHTHLLGDTLDLIAREKAGILKPGTVCVTAVPPGEARNAIQEIADARSVPVLHVAAQDAADAADAFVTYARHGTPDAPARFHVSGVGAITLPPLQLRGAFQVANAATALAALTVLKQRHHIAIPDEAIRRGLAGATLPGRFQIVRSGDPALVLDVAHNADGAHVLARALGDAFPGRRFTFVVGMTRSHEPEPFLQTLAPLVTRVVATTPTFRPKPATETADAARALGLPTTVIEPAAQAIAQTWETARPGQVVVVTGSFYVVGETPPPLRS